MAIEIRPARTEEMLEMGRIGAYVYAGSFGDDPDNVISQSNRPEWTLCAFEAGEMVAMFSAIPFTMRALGRAVPMAGISSVGTMPEHRRKGLLRSIMTRAFADMRERGQSVASLWASQAAIYQRYQFAMTTVLRRYRIDTSDIAFHDRNAGTCDVARSELPGAFEQMKAIYIRFIADRIGYLHRAAPLWHNNVLRESGDDGPIHVAICRDGAGDAVGYLVYTVRSGRTGHPTRGQEMRVRELVWLSQDAYRSLWRFISLHDLVGAVLLEGLPVDDPASELLMEPRLLNARDDEGQWSRIIDVEQSLATRGYGGSGHLDIGIEEDELAPWNGGTYALDASPDGATAARATGDPEITLSVKALASLYFGFRSAHELAAWGLLGGAPDAVDRAAAIFRTPHRPHCPDHY